MEVEQGECVICLEILADADRYDLTCQHNQFHDKCILKWFSHCNSHLTCPICRYFEGAEPSPASEEDVSLSYTPSVCLWVVRRYSCLGPFFVVLVFVMMYLREIFLSFLCFFTLLVLNGCFFVGQRYIDSSETVRLDY